MATYVLLPISVTPKPIMVRTIRQNCFEQMPASGRDDMFVQRALARVLAHVFGHGGEAAVLRTLKAEGKTPGDVADLWTMCRLLKIVGEPTSLI